MVFRCFEYKSNDFTARQIDLKKIVLNPSPSYYRHVFTWSHRIQHPRLEDFVRRLHCSLLHSTPLHPVRSGVGPMVKPSRTDGGNQQNIRKDCQMESYKVSKVAKTFVTGIDDFHQGYFQWN